MKHLGIVSQPQDLVTLEVLQALSTKWSFGDGPPSDAAGVRGEHYVEANNRVWIKTATNWIFTGIQLGSSANVAEKAVLVDADVLSIGDSANDLQMRRVTVAEFRSQFLTTALADAAASPDLPSTSAATWQSIAQTLRNGLKWLMSRFNSAGQLAPAYGGTGTNDLANLPLSSATQAALATKVIQGYANTYPVITDVITDANDPRNAWAQVTPQTVNGPGGYALLHTMTTQAGVLVPTDGVWLTQVAYGTGPNAGSAMRTSTNGEAYGPWSTQIASFPGRETPLGDAASAPLLRTNALVTGYGSFAYPSVVVGDGQYGAYVESGSLRLRSQGSYSVMDYAGNWSLPGDARTFYGPNTTWGGVLQVGSGAWSANTNIEAAQVNCTNGNLHLDARFDNKIHLNFYRGKGVLFGNGQMGAVAEVTPSGEWRGTNVHATQDNAYEIGGTNARFAVAYFGSNPIVTSDRRLKTDLGATLGLDFVLALRPQSYRLLDAKVTVDTEHDGYEDVQEQVHETRKVGSAEIVIVGGKPVRKTVEREERVPVFDLLPLSDEDGAAVLDEHDQPVMHPVPRMHTVQRPRTRQVRKVGEGVRRHHGLLAQQVLEVLEAQGLTDMDFAGLIHDADADTWGLRYEQFVAPLISAVQTQAKQIAQLQNQVEKLLLLSPQGDSAPQ